MPKVRLQAAVAAPGEPCHGGDRRGAAKILFMRSVTSIGVGMLVAFAFILLILFGILAPVLSWLFQVRPSASGIKTFAPVLLVICGLGFYFGGMAGAYKAPGRHRLHGTLVAPVAFLISPVMNLLLGKTPFPGLDSVGSVLLAAAFLAAAVGAAHVGARRGQTLHAHNERVLQLMRRSKARGAPRQ